MPHSISPEVSSQEEGKMSEIPVEPTTVDAQAEEVEDTPMDEEKLPAKNNDVKLEDLFQTDDEDDEYSSSMPASSGVSKPMPSSPPMAALSLKPTTNYSDPEIMLAFYQRLFPFRPLFQWLNCSMKPNNNFANREFAFTLQNDAYLRYQSFPTADLLRKEVLRLNPPRFEIGPVYSTNPRDRKTLRKASAFRPVSRELVFDIDMDAYDEIRTCCTGANICSRCWQFITMAIKTVNEALREDFGFEHILWVYSGRRGAHCWVSDKKAREMEDSKRRAIAGYLEVVKGGSQGGKKVNIKRPLHPHLSRSLDILKDHFQSDVLEAQDPWETPAKTENLLALLPDKALVDALRKKWESAPGRSSSSKWADIDALAKSGVSKTLDSKNLLEAKKDIVLEYTYPRLDAEVSKKLNHLLKSPFVVHPKTGRVCVPIDVKKLEDFDPEAVPTVTDLLSEIDAWKAEEGEDASKVADYEKTSLKPYVDLFKTHVAGILKEERGIKREREEGDPMEF